jgi:hypothetical protein
MTVTLPVLVVSLAVATPAAADVGATPGPIHQSIRREASRLAASEAAASRQAPPASGRRSWERRHPVATTALVAGLGGFAVGWSMGDDGLLDDFTGEFNGLVLGGICAGAGAAVVALFR